MTDEYHADSGHLANVYDAFGNLAESTNEVGAVSDYTYDKDGNLLTETHPLSAYDGATRLVDTYTYDGLGQRLTHYNSQLGSGVKETTDYDAEGRVTATVDMGGHETDYTYAWSSANATAGLGTYGGWTKTTTNTAAKTLTDTTDADGRTIGHVDFGGHTLSYTYNMAGWLQERDDTYGVQTYSFGAGGAIHLTSQGEALTYSYFNTGLKQETSSTYRAAEFEKGVGGDYDTYELDTDTLTSDYAYDKDGNETFEDQIHFMETFPSDTVTDSSTLTEYETATFDAMNRITEMKDSAAGVTISGVTNAVDDPVDITLKYDLAGNIRNRHATYYDLDNSGTVLTTLQTQDDWYTYDGMNRFLISKGTLASGAITYSTNGTLFTYDKAGERATATSAAETDTYTYAKDGYLTETDITVSGGTEKSTSAYDLMGRVLTYKEYDTTAAVVYSKVTTFNALSQDTTDTVFSNRGGTNGAWTWVTTYDYNDLSGSTYTGQYEGGQIVHDHTHTTVTGGPTAPPDTDSAFGYMWFDNSVESAETYQPNSTTTWTSALTYDPRQALYEANIHDGQARDVFYAENLDGEITQRDTGTAGFTGKHNNIVGPHARYYYFGGIRMGDVSNDGTSDVNYVASITDHKTKPGTGLFQNGGTTETKYADFDASYDPINGLTYQDAPGSYTVQGGDTLQSIAQQIWGDSNFWYLLADANGMDLSTNLIAGQTLIIPNKVANNQNNTGTYRVYDPNDTIGNISPTTPPKPSPQHGPKCGVFGEILLAIVAVVVSVVTYGALAGPAAGLLGSIEAGAIAGAAGSVASQTLGVITGIQKSFNWGAVALSAIGGAVGAGVGPSGANLFGSMSGSIGADGVAALQGITSNVITQGIGVATGLQKSFDWASVAAAGLSAGVIKEVGTDLGFNPGGTDALNLAKGAVAGMAGVIANASARTLINGSDFGDNILKALPVVIGQTIGSALEGQINRPSSSASSDLTGATVQTIPVTIADLPPAAPNPDNDAVDTCSGTPGQPATAPAPAPSPSFGDKLEAYFAYRVQTIENSIEQIPGNIAHFMGRTVAGWLGDDSDPELDGIETVVVTPDPSVGSVLGDIGKGAYNAAVGVADLSSFVQSFGLMQFLGISPSQTMRATYDTPWIGQDSEVVTGIGVGGAAGEISELSEAGNVLSEASETTLVKNPEVEGQDISGPPPPPSYINEDGTLLNADQATMAPNKLQWPLQGDPDKARVFQSSLGYNMSNADGLADQIMDGVSQYPAEVGKVDEYGNRFNVTIPVTGPNGNTMPVITGWIYDPGSDIPRFVTAYIRPPK